MSKSKQGYTRRAFMVLGSAAAGAATLTGTAQAGGSHKKIHEAISALQAARDYLEHAGHDFGGHRVDAIEHIDGAIHHLKLCLKY
jgi:hypothetical protein